MASCTPTDYVVLCCRDSGAGDTLCGHGCDLPLQPALLLRHWSDFPEHALHTSGVTLELIYTLSLPAILASQVRTVFADEVPRLAAGVGSPICFLLLQTAKLIAIIDSCSLQEEFGTQSIFFICQCKSHCGPPCVIMPESPGAIGLVWSRPSK